MQRALTALVAAMAATVLAACGSSSHPTRPASVAQSRPGGTPAATASAPRTSASAAAGHGTAAPAPGTAAASAPAGSAPATAPSASPSHNWTATPEELPIQAAVNPGCVASGAKVTLDVKTKGGAAVAFVAVYAGEKSGAAPPWGEGYGGNDKGWADGHGKWSTSWTVRVDTPPGPAYVQLVVGYGGKSRQIKVPFSVAQATGCGT
jgi:hypothetical protein